jgi:hypothetical protein
LSVSCRIEKRDFVNPREEQEPTPITLGFERPNYLHSQGQTEMTMPTKKPSTQKETPPWDKKNPRKRAGAPSKHLTHDQKAEAKKSAKAAGRPYPNLVDNMRVARKKSEPAK